MWLELPILIIFFGVVCSIIGYYEKEKQFWTKPKIIYKFIDDTLEELYAKEHEDVYNKYNPLFLNKSLL